ncbi:MAG: C25 family cysteine peptidase [Flavisolibacter sp.]
MRKSLVFCLLLIPFLAMSQAFNNEWIDHNKTYYTFKIAKTGLYRLPQSALSAAGLGGTPAEQFQLWRNGVQVPVYTSVTSGALGAGDYIEFWGEMNDGKPDRELYRKPEFQLNDKWSLISDTAVYFLTVNTNTTANLSLANTVNNVAGNSLPAEPYFLYTTGKYFKDKINRGEAVIVGDPLYSSSYDRGEGWTSADLVTTYSAANGFANGSNTVSFSNLFPYTAGPAAKFRISVSGNWSMNNRRYLATINGDSVVGNTVYSMNAVTDSTSFPLSLLSSGEATVVVKNLTMCSNPPNCPAVDRMVVHKYEMTYARQFNFGGASSFEFELPASAASRYLEITGFNYGSAAPVLYDLTNGKRYVADINAAPQVRIVLQPSATPLRLVLVSEESANVSTISSLVTKTFTNFNQGSNQGNYLVVSNPLLYNGSNGNPVEAYRQYRASAAGGGYNAKLINAAELVDQFGFGIPNNPAGIRNFVRFATSKFQVKPEYLFLIGKGVNYVEQRSVELQNNPADLSNIKKLNLVPTFGFPASDVLMASELGTAVPLIPVGRLSAVHPEEVSLYLAKMQEYELAQKTLSPKLEDRNWMKNVVHIVGASDEGLDALLFQYLENYRHTIEDTLFGGHVSTFRKTTNQAGETLTNSDLSRLFKDGISLITYFGHSSDITLDFNLDDPQNYDNSGKYPLFIGLGCNAGDFFKYKPVRLTQNETISEKYVLAPNRGTIGFIASTHFGVIHLLDQWNNRAYERISRLNYGEPIGDIMRKTILDIYNPASEDLLTRANVEQTELHGDPALRLNTHPKPDYIIEEQLVKTEPAFISVADNEFTVKVKMYNNGKAVDKDIVVETKRQVGNGPVEVFRRDTIPGIRYADSLEFVVPVDPVTDKGLNKLIITVDADNAVDEIYESNNTVTKEITVLEDEARPVYPYPFAIVNKQNIKLVASTANAFAPEKTYRMELDTTELFNSGLKVTKEITSVGGALSFDPGVNFTDSTVYYWRVAVVPVSGGITNWNTSSFVYLPNSDLGYNQSHLYQHFKSEGERITLDSTTGQWKYRDVMQNLFIRHGTWVTSTTQETGLTVAVNFQDYIRNACAFQSVVFNVFDPVTLKAMRNVNSGSPVKGLYNSWPICSETRNWNFEYKYTDSTNRRLARDFMRDAIPDGSIVVVRSFALDPNDFSPTAYPQVFADQWKADQSIYGTGNTLYDYLKNAGLTDIDSFSRPRQFVLVYKKNDPSFQPRWFFTDGTTDNKTMSVDVVTKDTVGRITSPEFGPAKAWKELKWRGRSMDSNGGDNPQVNVIGITASGAVDTLMRNIGLSQQNVDLSGISASQYPFLQLSMLNQDTLQHTPYQLRYWRITYDPVPEGAMAPNIFMSMKDSFAVAEPLDFKIAFKNVSDAAFDSLKVKLLLTDQNNVQHALAPFKLRALPAGDTLHVRYPLDTKQYPGSNTLFVEVNPDNDQPEQYHFNNMASFAFTVRPDTLNPLLDVTFDNVHILNNDIVSSKPNVEIRLTDESKWMISDPSTVQVQVRYPNGNLRSFAFTADTLQFVAPDPGGDNTARVIFRPAFLEDGQYELIVSGKDMSDNPAGAMQYRVQFQVINKAMISNLLNYPNPFTTSTAFVFTVTGSEVPDNFKIQILTVTGKVVREITKEELGPLHIGRNITEFKWDGTDQYGQKLGNGVYLYRVVTALHGQRLEKYRDGDDNTDKFFNKGYGKMYLMR